MNFENIQRRCIKEVVNKVLFIGFQYKEFTLELFTNDSNPIRDESALIAISFKDEMIFLDDTARYIDETDLSFLRFILDIFNDTNSFLPKEFTSWLEDKSDIINKCIYDDEYLSKYVHRKESKLKQLIAKLQ